MPLSRRKRIVFAIAAFMLASIAALGALLAVDIYLHSKFERSAGVNIWGYRGPVAGRKAPGELRVAVLGGSTAYGYGVTPEESMPAYLEKSMRARRATSQPVSVVNLAYNNEGAYSYAFTLRDYAYLDYDIVAITQGYNDLGFAPNTQVYRHESPIFRAIGYLPIFPLVFKEKAAALLHGGDVAAAYREARGEARTTFRPALANRATAGVLNAAAAVADSLSRQIGRPSADSAWKDGTKAPEGCAEGEWAPFCTFMVDAIELALSNGKKVLVITQPYLAGASEVRNRHQQVALRAALSRRYGANGRVRYVDLAEAIDLNDRTLCYDGMHLTAAGNQAIAGRLVDPLLALAKP